MNTENANTEPYRQYHDFHENLNTTVKVLASSVVYMCNDADDKKFKNALNKAEESWKFAPIASIDFLPENRMLSTITTLGIVSAFSAMDDLIIGIEAEISRWNSKLDKKKRLIPQENYPQSDEKIINLYSKYNWSTSNVENQFDILKYFRYVRNCISHRNSKVSDALSELSKSVDFQEYFKRFYSRDDKPDLPKFEPDEEIILEPRLAFFCSNILRNIAKDFNEKLIAHLNDDGLINMAAHHIFFKTDIIRTPSHRTPEAVLNNILQHRYRGIQKKV